MISYLQSRTTYLQYENKLLVWPLAIIDIDNYYLTLNGLKAFIKPFEAPQRSVKIKI